MTTIQHLKPATAILTIAATLAMASLATTARAVPYASSITNSGGTVFYTLNENADSVKVVLNGGAGGTLNLGSQTKGVHSFSLGTNTSYSIQVTKSAPAGWTVISDDLDPVVRFYSARGVAVNANPSDLRTFGRIYVDNASPGTTTEPPTASSRFTGRGLYVLNPDLTDTFNQGTNMRNAGLTFAASASSPWRMEVGPDGYLYIADFSAANGGLFRADPDLASSILVLEGVGSAANPTVHTTIGGFVILGTTNAGDLVVFGVDGAFPGNFNKVMRWDIGPGPLPWNTAPTILGGAGIGSVANVTSDMEIGPDGKVYTMLNRSAGTDSDSIRVYDTDGTTLLWGSLTQLGSPDPLRQTRCVKFTPDGKRLATLTDYNDIRLLPLTNGIPDISGIELITGATAFGSAVTAGRDLTFDAVGNLYAVSSGAEKMRVLSPGGYTVATTTFDGTKGAFTVTRPATEISVTASAPLASEAGANGVFTIARVGDTASALTVYYALSGTASNSVDYTNLTGSVVIPGGSSTVDVHVAPVQDTIAELSETVVLSLAASSNYTVVAPASATVTIADDETPELTLSAVYASMYERLANDYVRLQLTRRGDTNVALTLDASAFTCSGMAVSNVDYALSAGLMIFFNPGDVTQNFDFATPIDNSALTGNKTFTIGLVSGTGYVAATNTVTATIVDDEGPAETVLFEDKFNTDSSASWKLYFATTNDAPVDYTATFAYDYSALGIPPAPHSGADTHGVYLQVNKDTTPVAAALNLYPRNRSFSGDFALRFDMYLIVNNCSYTTEYALFGINHSGNQTNWFRNSAGGVPVGWTFDGLWYGVEADAAALGDYVLYSSPTVANNPTALTPGVNASTLTGVFKSPPFAFAGAPANLTSSTTPSWTDVEVSQIGGVVTLKIDNAVIMTYNNVTSYTSGNVMLGYCDAYDSIGCDAAVIYDNVRVVDLTVAKTHIGTARLINGGTQVEITFTAGATDTPSAFKLQSAANVTGTYADDNAATLSQVSPGVFKATVNVGGAVSFYRIRRL